GPGRHARSPSARLDSPHASRQRDPADRVRLVFRAVTCTNSAHTGLAAGDNRTTMPRTVEEERRMGEHHRRIVAGLTRADTADPGLDGLHQVPVPLAPEIRLHLATDAIVLWARLEAEAGTKMASPFWASAWLGGQAL